MFLVTILLNNYLKCKHILDSWNPKVQFSLIENARTCNKHALATHPYIDIHMRRRQALQVYAPSQAYLMFTIRNLENKGLGLHLVVCTTEKKFNNPLKSIKWQGFEKLEYSGQSLDKKHSCR